MSYFLGGKRIKRRMQVNFDTIICSANESGFRDVFLKECKWWAVRIGQKSLPKLKYIALYRIRPVSKITHFGEIERIEPYGEPSKYRVILKSKPLELKKPLGLGKNPHLKPQSPKFALLRRLKRARSLDDVFGE